jgi:hypothetical protein
MAAGASGSLTDWAMSSLRRGDCWLSSTATSLRVSRQRGTQRCTAGFLVSDFRISNGYSVSVSHPGASRA